jgi:orotidine-5'-phosphate decarboxylase
MKQTASSEFLFAALTACREALDEMAAQSEGYGSELVYQMAHRLDAIREIAEDYAHYVRTP